MCSAGLALGAVGGFASYQGTRIQAAAQSAEYAATVRSNEFASLVSENNAKIAEMQAEDAQLRGIQKQIDLQRETGQMKGQGRTGYASGNVQVGSGSAMAWEQDLASGVARERIAIERNTDMEKWGFKVEAQNERNQASLSRLGAVNARTASNVAQSAGNFAKIGSLISTARLFADQFPVPNKKRRIGPNDVAVD